MRNALSKLLPILLVSLSLLGTACAHYVTVENPPSVNLRQFEAVGLVKFTAKDEPLSSDVTQRFLATMQNAQPGVRVQQLGDAKSVLAAVGGTAFDPTTLQAIAAKWNVGAVIIGELEVSKPTPRVTVGQGLDSLNAKVQVDGSLRATLYDPTGATLWTNGAHGSWTLGGMGLGGGGGIGVADPVMKYRQMLGDLVRLTTDDFRTTWVRRKVEKVQ